MSTQRPHGYLIVIEDAGPNYSAYSPDLPGCVAIGDTVEETEASMHEAIDAHLDVMRDYGDPLPQPRTHVAYHPSAA